MVGTCLEESDKISTISRRVKGQSAKIPVPCLEIIKDSNFDMSGVDLLDQKTAAYKLDRKSSGWRYYLRFFFDLMDISGVNSDIIYKKLNPKGMELLDFKIVLAKSLVGTYNSRSRNTPASHVSRREVLPASALFISQFYNKQEESVYTAILEVLGTKLTLNVIHVESFCA